MDDDTTASAKAGTGNRHLSRRTVLRAAGHAAWVVPAIQVVSMAPAFAAASDVLQITAPTGQWTFNNQPMRDYVTCSVTVTNGSMTDPATSLQVILTFSNLYARNRGNALTISDVTGGWSAGAVVYGPNGGGRTATVVFTADSQLADGLSSILGFRATTTRNVANANGADTIDGQATALDFTPGAISINPI